jgi:hypothetical protein
MSNEPKRGYANPYICGIGLGIVMLISFLVAGRGLGVSGAFDRLVSTVLENTSFRSLTGDWIVWEVIGLILGAALSGFLAGRMRLMVNKGPTIAIRTRVVLAAGGGILVGFGSRLAHGCTSGQALSGGALLSVGSWIFMLTLFGTAYALAGILRKVWQ